MSTSTVDEIRSIASAHRIAITDLIVGLIAEDQPICVGVSGGKDSACVAFAVLGFLDAVGHAGPRLLVHADLGSVEWADSLRVCSRLAERLKVQLQVVRREAGGMMERWRQRWDDNVGRYARLERVKIAKPWSDSNWRFCTSELKIFPSGNMLKRRYPGRTIVSVSGIRREESQQRAKTAVAKPQRALEAKTTRTSGYDWNPIVDWTREEVLEYLADLGFALHEGYTVYGMHRISCRFCVLASLHDLTASAACPENRASFRDMVALETVSTFSFQSGRWLGDVAPHLLDDDEREAYALAKERAVVRRAAEARIPDHLLYDGDGWPKVIPTAEEAELLAEVRRDVAAALGIHVDFTDGPSVLARYEELFAERVAAEAKQAAKEKRAAARRALAEAVLPFEPLDTTGEHAEHAA